MVRWFRSFLCIQLLLFACQLNAQENPTSEYIIRPGDVLQLTVASVPDLRAKSTVDLDGNIHFPLVPSLKAGGLKLSDALSRIKEQLKSKTFRQLLSDGRENLLPIDPDELSLEISDYRPIYVRGDVSKPGELPYRPGLTVRQVIALAGGYDVMRFHLENPFLQAFDLRAEYQNLWTDFAHEQARALILKSQLENKDPPDLVDTLQVPIPKDVIKQIASTETEWGKAQKLDYDRQRQFLQHGADVSQEQLNTFIGPRDDAQLSEADDLKYKQKLAELFAKGTISHERVSEQQRSLLESTQRFLDYSLRISELERAKDEYVRQRERLDDQHRSQVYMDLQESNVQIAKLRDRLQSVGEKLLYTGAVRSQLVSGRASPPKIEIHGTRQGQVTTFQGDEETVLLPDDVVDISLSAELTPSGNIN